MSLSFTKETATMADRIAPRRLYLTADKSEVVGEGDERAAFLLAGKGCQIPTDFDGDIPAELLEDAAPSDEVTDEVAEDAAPSDDVVPEKPEGAPTSKRRSRNTAAAEAADTEE